jgi:hypothetical protein
LSSKVSFSLFKSLFVSLSLRKTKVSPKDIDANRRGLFNNHAGYQNPPLGSARRPRSSKTSGEGGQQEQHSNRGSRSSSSFAASSISGSS